MIVLIACAFQDPWHDAPDSCHTLLCVHDCCQPPFFGYTYAAMVYGSGFSHTHLCHAQAAQDRQARGVKRSADVLLKDEEDQRFHAAQHGTGQRREQGPPAGQHGMGWQQQELSDLTGSHTEDGNDEPLADEDDMEEEVVGKIGQCWHAQQRLTCHVSRFRLHSLTMLLTMLYAKAFAPWPVHTALLQGTSQGFRASHRHTHQGFVRACDKL